MVLALDNEYELHKKMLNSQGMQFLDRMRAHSFSYNIFSMNYHEIKEALKLIENPEIGIKLFAINNREAGDQAYREINRLFHNFLASAQTLVEHTRIFMRSHYKNTEIYPLYSKKISDDYANDRLCRFIQDLRNYMLHKGLPHSNMTLSGSFEGQIESSISLDTTKLKSWLKWS